MEDPEWGKMISAFIACAIKPGLVGLPASVFAYHFGFLKTLLIGASGGVAGSLVFGYLSEEVMILWNRIMKKIFPNKKKKRRMTKTNRMLVGIKKYFGIPGIAIISPLFLSIPLGSFLAIRFFGDRHRTVLWMSVCSVCWTVILYLVYHGFYTTLMNLFN